MESKELQKMIARLESLPPIPKIAQQILALKISTEDGERKLFRLIEEDPTLMTKIIGLANSPLLSAGRTILTLHEAKILLGSKRVKNIALGFAMMSSVSRQTKGLLDLEELWKHSLSIAMTMDILVRYMPASRRPAEEEIYLSGLLHDIGFLVLNYLDTPLCDRFYARLSAEPNRPVEEIEAEMLGMNHCELGAQLAKQWGLPENIIAVLRYHHHPDEYPDAAHQPLVSLSYLAAKLVPTFGIHEQPPQDVTPAEWQFLGIDPKLANEIKNLVKEHIAQGHTRIE